MDEYEIKCVAKDGDGAIRKIGFLRKGTVYIIPREEAVKYIKDKTASFYVCDEQGAKVHVYDKDFLRSTDDDTTYNNLDSLKPCRV